MTNKELASKFNLLGKIMELHGENQFKTKSYTNAYLTLRKLPDELDGKTEAELNEIPGIGKAIAAKIRELLDTGEMATLNKYLELTPEGIREMLDIRGFGAKKILTIWKELGIETIGELHYACTENRLVELKGFGLKTQAQLQEQLEYFMESRGYSLYAYIKPDADELLNILRKRYMDNTFILVGEIARKLPVVSNIEILTDKKVDKISFHDIEGIELEKNKIKYSGHSVLFHQVEEEELGLQNIILSSSDGFRDAFLEFGPENAIEEEAIFDALDLAFIPSELREDEYWLTRAQDYSIPELIVEKDIKGVVHNHSTYSDGLNTVEEMAKECIKLGYDYLVMSDHSKSAFYANGLKENDVFHQQELIDGLNVKYPDFKIFKSIESDILSDGSLDYEEDVLKTFDLVIASIHSNLKMEEEKANIRLIKAIENPYTRILGHPTGRLLLARKGYPIDHKKIIDACAANDVVIELNANPVRLDLDWEWISYAIERGVMISINPDAHSTKGIKDIKWGVAAARKGGLTKESCLNTKSLVEFERWIQSKRR